MVSIKDIAKETGFSVTTVSRALNNHTDVSKKTKKIINEAAKKLNYVPNLSAKVLVNQSSKTIGLITNRLVSGSLIDNFAVRVFLGMFDTSKDYEVILIHYDSDFFSSKSFDRILRERQLEGAVIQGFDEGDPFIQEVLSSGYPAVFVDIGHKNDTTSYVSSDIRQAFRLGMDCIEKAGFEKITIVVGSSASYITGVWMKEIDKYLREHPTTNLQLINGEYTEEGAKKAVISQLEQGSQSEIYFCLSDLMAIGVYEALEQFGLRIPQDVSVLGYDDIVLSRYITPKLSSIAQDWEKIGETAMIQLMEMIRGEKPDPKMLPVTLRLRESLAEKKVGNGELI